VTLANSDQKYWRAVAKAGGCESKAQAVATKLFLNQHRDRNFTLVDSVPLGRTYQLVADMLNQLGFKTDTGRLWKKARTQQVIMAGLARQMTFLQIHQLKLRGLPFDRAVADAEKTMWRVFQRKTKSVRCNERPSYGRMMVGATLICCDRPPRSEQYWARKKLAARERGWRPPERWFTPPPEERYPEKRLDY
jgi:hypothetical protein